MLPVLEKLLILQERDEKLTLLREELARIPLEEKAAEDKWQGAAKRLEQLRAALKQLEVERKKMELEISAKQEQIGRYKGQQLQTRNNDEFAALNHQVGHAEKEIVAIEDKELAVMEQVSEMEKQVKAEEGALKEQEARVVQQRAVFKERRGRLEEEITRIAALQATAETEAEAAQEGILSRYRRIMQSKKKQAIVAVNHGACGGCHMKLTPQTVIAVRGKEITACENCGRLLYSAE